MKKPLVIYHGNCADGFAAAWTFWRDYRDNMDYYPGVYQNPPPDVHGRRVYLVDFSYKRAVFEQMLKEAEHVTIIDHHKSAIEDLASLCHLKLTKYFDMTHSGAMLAWQFLKNEAAPPELLKRIEDRDLWQFAYPDTRCVQAAVFSYPYDFEVWDDLMRMPLKQLAADGLAIERKHFKDINELMQAKRPMVIAGYTVPTLNVSYTMSSDAGNLLAEGHPFAACYMDAATGRNFSLRSNDNGLDVSMIAAEFGGGGHRNAAGFAVPRNHPLAMC